MNVARLLLVLTCLAVAAPTFAQRTDGRQSRTAVKHLEEDPDYLAKLPRVIWRRPMGPYVYDVWSGYRGGPGPGKMICRQEGHQLKILGANFLLVWDGRRGGELSGIFLYDGGVWGHVSCTMAYDGRDTIPRYRIQRRKDFNGDSPVYYLNQATGTTFSVTRNDPDRVDFSAGNRMVTTDREPSPWTVKQDFRVYPQGVVICDFEIRLDETHGTFGLRHARMGTYLEDVLFKEIYVAYPVHFRWGTCDFGGPTVSKANWEKLQEDRLVPMGSASFGVSRFADFTNRFEFWLERPRPFAVKDARTAGTNFEVFSSGLWYEPSDMSTRPNCGRAYEWDLHRGDPVDIVPPFVYRNRWVLAVGGAKVARGNVGAARRNNLLGARVVRWNGKEMPSDATLDALATLGANVILLPPPADAFRLKAPAAKARDAGMRVIASLPLAEAAGAEALFAGTLAKDHDGLLIDGLGSLTMKPDDDADAPAYDVASRVETLARLRRLVGDAGVLVGRAPSGLPAQIETAFLDAVVPADDVAAKLVASTDALLTAEASCGGALAPSVPGDDRRIAAVIAATPAVPLVLSESDGGDELREILPLWKLLSRLDGGNLHALSPRTENNENLQVEPRQFPVICYLTDTKALLIAARPSGKSTCKVTMGEALGVAGDASGTQLTGEDGAGGETPARLSSGVLDLGELSAGEVRAYEFPRTPANGTRAP